MVTLMITQIVHYIQQAARRPQKHMEQTFISLRLVGGLPLCCRVVGLAFCITKQRAVVVVKYNSMVVVNEMSTLCII